MKANWLALAAVTAFAAAPVAAQDAVIIATPVRPEINFTRVDMSEVRDYMNSLRNYLNEIQANNRLEFASSDIIQKDAYRRMNKVLIDNAYALGLNLLDEMGPATRIPPGLGATRSYVSMMMNHIRFARMMATYDNPVNEAMESLKNAFEAMEMVNVAMTGVMVIGTPGANMTPGAMGTNMNRTDANRSQEGYIEPGMNMSNPAMQQYNRQNDAATGVGATTNVPNTTPGQPGTGNTDMDDDKVQGDMNKMAPSD